MTERIRITDPNPVVEEMLEKMDRRVNQTIMGPDGVTPIFEPLIDNRLLTYAKDGESYSLDPYELLKRAARMHRDGMSLANIRAELDLVNVSDRLLNEAIKVGMAWLDRDIAAGEEPEESVRVLGYQLAEDPAEPEEAEEANEATMDDIVQVAKMLGGRHG